MSFDRLLALIAVAFALLALVLPLGNASVDVALLVSLVQTLLLMGVVLFGFGFLGELLAGIREEQRELARRLESDRVD